MGRLPTILFQCDASCKKMGGWKTTLWLQQQPMHRRLRPLHAGVCTFLWKHASALPIKPITKRMFHIMSVLLTCFPFSRSYGRTATRLAVLPSCAPVVSKALVLPHKRASFLFATMRQGKLTASTHTLQVYDFVFPLTVWDFNGTVLLRYVTVSWYVVLHNYYHH